jgi:hypothetical protein
MVSGLFSEDFEFLGIRSGMTRKEVNVVIEYDKLSDKGKWNTPKSLFDSDILVLSQRKDGKDIYIDKEYVNKFTEYPAYEIRLFFTADSILWKILILIKRTYSGSRLYPINSEAQLSAIKSSFPKAYIEVSDILGSDEIFIHISLTDDEIFNMAVQKKMDEYLIQYKD